MVFYVWVFNIPRMIRVCVSYTGPIRAVLSLVNLAAMNSLYSERCIGRREELCYSSRKRERVGLWSLVIVYK